MLCPRCGTDNVPDAQFCARCWSPLRPAEHTAPPPERHGETAPRVAYDTAPHSGPAFGEVYDGGVRSPVARSHPGVSYGAARGGASAKAVVACVLGALSTFMWCPALSIAAIVIGRSEVKAIERGQSSPEGHTLAKVGYILGIVFTIMHVGAFLVFGLIYGAAIVIWILAALAAAASGG